MLQDYDASDLDEFSHTILKGCDVNKNGRVSQKVFLAAKSSSTSPSWVSDSKQAYKVM